MAHAHGRGGHGPKETQAMKRAPRKSERCTCARCKGLKSAHPRWGYDRREGPAQKCLLCKEPIGRRRYMLFIMLARFGTMIVGHRTCALAGGARERKGWVTP
jgi:hypothetical protein